jgi:hypothetical protein
MIPRALAEQQSLQKISHDVWAWAFQFPFNERTYAKRMAPPRTGYCAGWAKTMAEKSKENGQHLHSGNDHRCRKNEKQSTENAINQSSARNIELDKTYIHLYTTA